MVDNRELKKTLREIVAIVKDRDAQIESLSLQLKEVRSRVIELENIANDYARQIADF